MGQMRRNAPTYVMTTSSDVSGMETVLTSQKFVTRALTAGMEVTSSTVHILVMFAGLKGENLFLLSLNEEQFQLPLFGWLLYRTEGEM